VVFCGRVMRRGARPDVTDCLKPARDSPARAKKWVGWIIARAYFTNVPSSLRYGRNSAGNSFFSIRRTMHLAGSSHLLIFSM
jgi:hypothetical protein